MPESATELLDPPAADQAPVAPRTAEAGTVEAGTAGTGDVVAADLLVEEISIDGMCGVY
jgi:mycofactocin precursor